MPDTLFPVPIMTGMSIGPDEVSEFIFRQLFGENNELQLFKPNARNQRDYIRFRQNSFFGASGIYFDSTKAVIRGQWRERATGPGETWERGCLFIRPRDNRPDFRGVIRNVELYPFEQWAELLR